MKGGWVSRSTAGFQCHVVCVPSLLSEVVERLPRCCQPFSFGLARFGKRCMKWIKSFL